MASLTQWTWVWANSGSWWWTGRPGVLQSMGSQKVRHNWAAEWEQQGLDKGEEEYKEEEAEEKPVIFLMWLLTFVIFRVKASSSFPLKAKWREAGFHLTCVWVNISMSSQPPINTSSPSTLPRRKASPVFLGTWVTQGGWLKSRSWFGGCGVGLEILSV